MKFFDYSFLKTQRIPSNILSLFINIERFQVSGINNKKMYPQVFEEIQNISVFQSVKFSNQIDKIFANDILISSILSGSKNQHNSDETLIRGYSEVLNDIRDNYNEIQFSTYSIRNMHHILFSSSEHLNGGTYKQEDNLFKQTLGDGTERVILNPVTSGFTSKSMEELVQAYKKARDDIEIPTLLLIPCVILDFLLIYPFDDGNERISRLLSQLLLYKSDYEVGKYVSFEKQIYNSYEQYYDSIRKSSVNWEDNNNDYYPFIENFLISLYSSYVELNSRFKIVDGEKVNKKIRVEETIKRSFEPISRKEIHLVWPDISQETIKKVIKNLLNENKIKKIGNFKDARYKRNWYGSTTQNEENVVIF